MQAPERLFCGFPQRTPIGRQWTGFPSPPFGMGRIHETSRLLHRRVTCNKILHSPRPLSMVLARFRLRARTEFRLPRASQISFEFRLALLSPTATAAEDRRWKQGDSGNACRLILLALQRRRESRGEFADSSREEESSLLRTGHVAHVQQMHQVALPTPGTAAPVWPSVQVLKIGHFSWRGSTRKSDNWRESLFDSRREFHPSAVSSDANIALDNGLCKQNKLESPEMVVVCQVINLHMESFYCMKNHLETPVGPERQKL